MCKCAFDVSSYTYVSFGCNEIAIYDIIILYFTMIYYVIDQILLFYGTQFNYLSKSSLFWIELFFYIFLLTDAKCHE